MRMWAVQDLEQVLMEAGACFRSSAEQRQRLRNRQSRSRVRAHRLLGLQRVQCSQEEAMDQAAQETQEVVVEGLRPGGLRVEVVQ